MCDVMWRSNRGRRRGLLTQTQHARKYKSRAAWNPNPPKQKPRRPFEPVWARFWDAWDPGGGIRSSVRRLNAGWGSRVPHQLIGTRAGSSGIKVTGLCEERIILPMTKDRDLIERHARLFSGAKKRPNQDPRKARYAELVARTAHKYQEIAKSRGVPVKAKKTT
jgi:hypothetical protein